uniref:Uncharacterized protein n=1 Tax=Cacopsylla melanoneura TaxID=428564 RepID=A0A8D8WGD6_9HEMI
MYTRVALIFEVLKQGEKQERMKRQGKLRKRRILKQGEKQGKMLMLGIERQKEISKLGKYLGRTQYAGMQSGNVAWNEQRSGRLTLSCIRNSKSVLSKDPPMYVVVVVNSCSSHL